MDILLSCRPRQRRKSTVADLRDYSSRCEVGGKDFSREATTTAKPATGEGKGIGPPQGAQHHPGGNRLLRQIFCDSSQADTEYLALATPRLGQKVAQRVHRSDHPLDRTGLGGERHKRGPSLLLILPSWIARQATWTQERRVFVLTNPQPFD